MSQLNSILIVADTNGTTAPIFGNASLNTPAYRIGRVNGNTVTESLYIDYPLAGETYSVDHDSSGEVYAEFLDSSYQSVSDIVLLSRGAHVRVSANVVRVWGVRRCGIVRVVAGKSGVMLAPGDRELSPRLGAFGVRFPAGQGANTGPTGWTNTFHPFMTSSVNLAYKPTQIGFGGTFRGVCQRWLAGATVASNYNVLGYGFVRINENSSIVEFVNLYQMVSVAVGVGVFPPPATLCDISPDMYPCVYWNPTSAGVSANAVTALMHLVFNLEDYYLRSPLVGQAQDFT